MIIALYCSFLDHVLVFFMSKIDKLINYTCLIYMEEKFLDRQITKHQNLYQATRAMHCVQFSKESS